jgi:hypothetical protein
LCTIVFIDIAAYVREILRTSLVVHDSIYRYPFYRTEVIRYNISYRRRQLVAHIILLIIYLWYLCNICLLFTVIRCYIS